MLETARGGILRDGLGFDRCDVAVVTNIGEGDHLGLSDIDTLEKLAEVKRTIVDAVDRRRRGRAQGRRPARGRHGRRLPAAVIFFRSIADDPVIAEHRRTGGRAVFVRHGTIDRGRRRRGDSTGRAGRTCR